MGEIHRAFRLPSGEGGLTAQFLATGGDMKHALQVIDAFYEEIEAYPDQAMPAVCADDILRAKELGKIALVLKTQGVEGLEGDLRILRVWYRLGLRVLGLTGNERNEAADGVGERRTGGGLTCFGVDLIKECNRLGIIVDVAHVAPAGVRDVAARSH